MTRRVALWMMAVSAFVSAGCESSKPEGPVGEDQPDPLHVVVLDPLARPLSCDCIPGFAQRDYKRLAPVLADRLKRPVQLLFADSAAAVLRRNPGEIDVLIGPQSLIRHDAARLDAELTRLAGLTNTQGDTTLRGLFVVRASDPARGFADLDGRRIMLGPEGLAETSSAAREALGKAGVSLRDAPPRAESNNAAALAVVDGEADAAVVSDWALRLMIGCGNIGEDELRVVGRTAPTPFVAVFATPQLDAAGREALVEALSGIGRDAELLRALESARGFVAAGPATRPAGASGAE